MNAAARQLIAQLDLAPLPHEGGFFRQTWRSAAGSAIYFLLTPDDFSALHRLRTDEVWHFHAGDALEQVQLDPRDGALRRLVLGNRVLAGEQPQLVAPAGVWQGTRIAPDALGDRPPAGWALVSCTLAPAWDERDFELGAREALLRDFPAHAPVIRALTR